MNQPDPRATARTRNRYQRIARFYDLMEILPELRYRHWRKQLWSQVHGQSVLEVGVGTGKNMPFYPPGAQLTAIDLSPAMLDRARNKAAKLNLKAEFRLGDVQSLDFPDGVFDDVVASFVFCSVPDPVLGLSEVARVLKTEGRIHLLEHMRAKNKALGLLMDIANPFVVRIMGANINRRTIDNARRAGLNLHQIEDLGFNGIFKMFSADPVRNTPNGALFEF